MFSGGSDDVTVNINGNAMGLREAVAQSDASLQSFGDQAQSTSEKLSSTGDGVTTFGDRIKGLGGHLLSLSGNFLSTWAAIETWQGINDITQQVKNFADAMISLNINMEKNATAWEYLFGGGNTPQGKQTAQQIVDWTAQESINIPFTRQDLVSTISTLGSKESASQVEQFIPTLADITSTLGATAYGGQGLTLQQGAQAIVDFMEGRSMMLKQDLKIDPAELVKYGLDASVSKSGAVSIHDPSTIIPALEAFAKGRGLAGAAKDMSTDTVWGAWSSMIDRLQNAEMASGKGPFAVIKDDLNAISAWWDSHQDTIDKITTFISNVAGSALKDAGQNLQDFFAGLQGTGPDDLFGNLGGLAKSLGGDVGNLFSGLADGLSKLNANTSVNDIIKNLGKIFGDPMVQTGVKEFGTVLGMALGTGLSVGATLLGDIASAMQYLDTHKEAANTLKLYLEVLAGVIAVTLVPAFWSWATAAAAAALAQAAAFWPILLIAGAITLLIIGIKALVEHWSEVTGAFERFAASVGNWTDQIDPQLSTLKKKFADWAGGLGADLEMWGADMIQSFITGIGSKASDLGSMVQSLAGQIASFFQHSTPVAGPLHGDDQWFVHMMQGFEQQILQGTPAIAKASQNLGLAVQSGIDGSGNGYISNTNTNYSTSYGNSSNSITFNSANEAAIERVINRVMAQNNASANQDLRRPGGYMVFGGIGT